MQDTVILGAGLAGMSTAHYLRGKYEVFEKNDFAGGLCVTDERDGFYFDRTGHWLHMQDAGIKRMVTKIMNDKLLTVVRDSRIYSKGVYTLYPFQTNTYGLPVDVIKEIITGFLETTNTKNKINVKTFEDWVLKHMGSGIAKHFMIPYNEKLWCTHPKNLTPFWCQHYIPKPTLDAILDGALRSPDSNIGYNASFSYPISGGIGAISKALGDSLNQNHLHYQTRPKKIYAKKQMMELSNGETIAYNNLVSSIPLPELIKLIVDAPTSVQAAAKKLVCNQIFYYNIAIEGETFVPAHWVYYPEKPFRFYRAGSYSNAVKSMSPKGKSCLYVEISHRGELTSSKLSASNKKELDKKVIQGLLDSSFVKRRKDIIFSESQNIPYAYVVFDKNYEKSLKTIFVWMKKYNIQSIGRYGRWTYNSMESALIDGREAAKNIKRNR